MTAPTPNPRRVWDPRVWLLILAAVLAGFGATIAVVWAAQFNVPEPVAEPLLVPLDVTAACATFLSASAAIETKPRTDRPGWICSQTAGPATPLDPGLACEVLYGADARPVAPTGAGHRDWWCLTFPDPTG
jgi:hypothetical protein